MSIFKLKYMALVGALLVATATGFAAESYWDFASGISEIDLGVDASMPVEGLNYGIGLGIGIPGIMSINPAVAIAHTFPGDDAEGAVDVEGGIAIFKNLGDVLTLTPGISWLVCGAEEITDGTNVSEVLGNELTALFQIGYAFERATIWGIPEFVYNINDEAAIGRLALGVDVIVAPDIFETLLGFGADFPFDGSDAAYMVDVEFDYFAGRFNPILDVAYTFAGDDSELNIALGLVIGLAKE